MLAGSTKVVKPYGLWPADHQSFDHQSVPADMHPDAQPAEATAAMHASVGRSSDTARPAEDPGVCEPGVERAVSLPSTRQQTIVFIGVELQKARPLTFGSAFPHACKFYVGRCAADVRSP